MSLARELRRRGAATPRSPIHAPPSRTSMAQSPNHPCGSRDAAARAARGPRAKHGSRSSIAVGGNHGANSPACSRDDHEVAHAQVRADAWQEVHRQAWEHHQPRVEAQHALERYLAMERAGLSTPNPPQSAREKILSIGLGCAVADCTPMLQVQHCTPSAPRQHAVSKHHETQPTHTHPPL